MVGTNKIDHTTTLVCTVINYQKEILSLLETSPRDVRVGNVSLLEKCSLLERYLY
jgi:hypothetical protein